jgi:ketosteroid isomerase-like protein
MRHPHEELLRREADAGIRGGFIVADFYTEDHVLHYPGTSPVAGDYHGHAGLTEFGQGIAAIATLHPELHDAVANDEHGIQLVKVRAERQDGARHEWRVLWVFHFREGLIAESWAQVDDQAALDAFLSG